ncbi:MAG: hypothetical protein B7Y83_06295 [Flavobacteriales bacterium 32-34-25]|nr:MAG: hypothetical protein B7Y83_06295 [Flavobacteriales bacterium 32-34-25]
MNNKISHSLKSFQRYLFVFAAFLVMFLSSCSVKASIKTLAGFPPKTEQGMPKGNHNLPVNTFEKCSQIDVVDSQIDHKSSYSSQDLLPVILLAVTTFFFFGLRQQKKQTKHPLYNSSGKIRNSISIFLEYRKLLIHFSL